MGTIHAIKKKIEPVVQEEMSFKEKAYERQMDHSSLLAMLCLGSITMDHFISKSHHKGTTLQKNYRKNYHSYGIYPIILL